MEFDLVVKAKMSEDAKNKVYEAIGVLGDIEDELYKTGVTNATAKHITKTIEILRELVRTGIVED